ncbi:OLC1v1023853C1 [Oldenlandia corymbosa var. corymbosa]|uniref:OLC1v1023853C1 n=1 Tax=Oldenlandia corymbosa var. corymbosa TaxID=529605 RepID=A0AAV1C2C8_OLDCO|nr:OLC1v1023853C1 [Oldenlandia corymbosa var. corymbosa]
MARSNKYSSINFNDIYEKKVINSGSSNSSSNSSPFHHSSSSSSSGHSSFGNHSKPAISNSRIHGHMLVLSKPAAPKPKPIIIPQTTQQPQPQKAPSVSAPPPVGKPAKGASDQPGSESDSISLRPQGRTGSGSAVVVSPLPSPGKPSSPLSSPLLKSDRFVPPHLRPGFVGREEKPGPPVVKGGVQGGRGRGQFGYPNVYGEDGRPKSGGGYERMRRIGGEPEHVDFMIRPGSSGGRPSSSG